MRRERKEGWVEEEEIEGRQGGREERRTRGGQGLGSKVGKEKWGKRERWGARERLGRRREGS
jgi:hypothetical protein